MSFSFYKLDEAGCVVSMWSPEVTSDWGKDCEQGREYAREVIDSMCSGGSAPSVLGWIVRGFGQDEARRGVETGFCQQIAEAVLS